MILNPITFFTLNTISLLYLSLHIQSKVFTSMVEIETLFKLEKSIAKFLKLYIAAEEARLLSVKENIQNLSNSKFFNFTDVDVFITSPLNIYVLINKFATELAPLFSQLVATDLNALGKNSLIFKYGVRIPENEDIIEIAEGLERLRKCYNLEITTLSNNSMIQGFKGTLKLSADDCFRIGFILYKHKQNYEGAVIWYKEALRIEKYENPKSVARRTILEHMAYSFSKVEMISKTLNITQELTENEAQNFLILDENNNYQPLFFNYTIVNDNISAKEENLEEELFFRLCRNDYNKNFKKEANLKCYFSKDASPYLILQPTKVETVHLNPQIIILHDVIRNSEIAELISLSLPKMQRSLIIDESGKDTESLERISELAWISDIDSYTIWSFIDHLEAVTGLRVHSAGEHMQVNNYGFGGYYTPHHDFLNKSQIFGGDRMATILFYLNDVKAGGATIFPKLNITIFPKKGSAIFWYNLRKSGDGDLKTFHGSCPVLAGTKWIANKWIRADFHMFSKPCGLSKNDRYKF